jgi:hypothetical protein
MYTVCFTLPEAAAAARGLGIGDGEELGYVTEAEVLAVTSRIQLHDWLGASGDAHLGDLTWVAPRACRHQAIIEAVMGLAPAFPLSFGAVWSSEEKLRQYLRRFHDPIREFLSFISDKEEWTIKGALDQAQYDALHSGPQAEPLASSPPSGTGYLLAQKQRASAAVKTRDWLQLAEGVVLDNLRPLTLMRRRRRILPAQAGDSARLAFHWAVLIERSQRDSLLRLLDRGNDHWAPLGLKLIGQGPWPTYSFCPALASPAN